jgi:hypothetical protein
MIKKILLVLYVLCGIAIAYVLFYTFRIDILRKKISLVSYWGNSTTLKEMTLDGQIAWSCKDPGLILTRLSNGNMLINGYDDNGVIEMNKFGRVVWSYTKVGDISYASRLNNGNTLICDKGYGRIIEIEPKGEIKWEYGIMRNIFLGFPSCDTTFDSILKMLKKDDSEKVERYLKNNGYIIPTVCERLPNGNTLIGDKKYHRVIEVTPDKQIVFEFYFPQELKDFSKEEIVYPSGFFVDFVYDNVAEMERSEGIENVAPVPECIIPLPNENILILGERDCFLPSTIVEVSRTKGVVWECNFKDWKSKIIKDLWGNTHTIDSLDLIGSFVDDICSLKNGNIIIIARDIPAILEINKNKEVVKSYCWNKNKIGRGKRKIELRGFAVHQEL